MALRVELAGQVGLRADGGPVDVGSLRRPAWVALAYLAAERHRPVRRDELAEVLWGEEPPPSWDAMVRGLVSKLRGLLIEAGAGRETISTAFGCYQLVLPAGLVIDVEEAAADVAAAEAALAAGELARARAAASRAADVAARQFLPGAGGAWVERRQAELDDVRLRALEVLAHAASGWGDHAFAVEAAERVVALAPLRESGHLRLMSAHAAGGNRAEALRAYERCRRILVEEIGVSPSATIQALYLGLLEDDVAVVARPATAPPLPAALTAKDRPLFVGRQYERQQLDEAWKRARAGERQVVFVGGEPGIGKTRLVSELALRAHGDGAHVLYGRCDEELLAPYEPLADVVRQCLNHASAENLAARLQAPAGELARLVPEVALRLPAVPGPAPDDPAVARARLADAVDALLVTMATLPLLVVLDDLHWAGDPALAVLRRLIRSPLEAPLLLVATYRDTELTPDHSLSRLLADTRRDPSVTRLSLGAIAVDDVAALVTACAGVDTDPEETALAPALHAHTRGNPFFVGEVLQHLAASSVLGPGRMPNVAKLLAAVPEGVRETVSRRLLRLSAATNHVLAEAAVVGIEFDVTFLEEMGNGRDDLLDAVEEGVSAGLLVEMDSTGRYRFAHAIVRHTIYDQLRTVRRARLHRRAGQTLEHLYGRQGRHIALLAHHFCAGAPAGDAATAADYAQAAAQAAAEQLAYEEAVAHLRAGLAALDAGRPDPQRRWRLLIALALACGRVPDDDGRRWASEAAANMAREHRWVGRLAQAAMIRAESQPYNWRDPVAVSLCREALAAIGDDAPGLRSKLLCALVAVERDRPPDEKLGTGGRLAVHLARQSGDVGAIAKALAVSCTFLKGCARREDYLQMRDTAEELVSLRVSHGSDGDPVSWWLSRGTAATLRRGGGFRVEADLALGERRSLDTGLDELERDAVARGDKGHLGLVATWRSLLALSDGCFGEVETRCEQARVAMERAMGPQAGDLTRVHHLFRLRLEQDRLREFEEELVTTQERYPSCPTLQPMRALLWAQTDRTHLAAAQIGALGDCLPPYWAMPIGLLLLADLCASLDDETVAASIYERLRPHAGVFTFPPFAVMHLGATDHFLAILAATLRRWQDAEAHFAEALALHEAMKAHALTARTLYWKARMLSRRRAAGDVERAGTILADVSATTASLGMVGLDRQVRALLSSLDE